MIFTQLGLFIACAGLTVAPVNAEGTDGSSLDEPSSIVEVSSEAESSSEEAESSSEDLEPVSSDDLVTEDEDFDWSAWLAEWVSPSVLATITSVVTALVAVLKLAKSLKDMAKSKQLTVTEVQNQVVTALEKCVSEDTAKAINEYLPALQKASEKTDKVLAQFAKILALSQENTAESKLAILNALQEIGLVQAETIEEAKAEVTAQAEAEKADEEAKAEAVAKVIEETSSYDGTSI